MDKEMQNIYEKRKKPTSDAKHTTLASVNIRNPTLETPLAHS